MIHALLDPSGITLTANLFYFLMYFTPKNPIFQA
jgi:hypothetical protein